MFWQEGLGGAGWSWGLGVGGWGWGLGLVVSITELAFGVGSIEPTWMRKPDRRAYLDKVGLVLLYLGQQSLQPLSSLLPKAACLVEDACCRSFSQTLTSLEVPAAVFLLTTSMSPTAVAPQALYRSLKEPQSPLLAFQLEP